MIDETTIINKLEKIKENSREVMGEHKLLTQKHFEYILNKIIDYINEHKEQ